MGTGDSELLYYRGLVPVPTEQGPQDHEESL